MARGGAGFTAEFEEETGQGMTRPASSSMGCVSVSGSFLLVRRRTTMNEIMHVAVVVRASDGSRMTPANGRASIMKRDNIQRVGTELS